jgi:hypothetical protein
MEREKVLEARERRVADGNDPGVFTRDEGSHRVILALELRSVEHIAMGLDP